LDATNPHHPLSLRSGNIGVASFKLGQAQIAGDQIGISQLIRRLSGQAERPVFGCRRTCQECCRGHFVLLREYYANFLGQSAEAAPMIPVPSMTSDPGSGPTKLALLKVSSTKSTGPNPLASKSFSAVQACPSRSLWKSAVGRLHRAFAATPLPTAAPRPPQCVSMNATSMNWPRFAPRTLILRSYSTLLTPKSTL